MATTIVFFGLFLFPAFGVSRVDVCLVGPRRRVLRGLRNDSRFEGLHPAALREEISAPVSTGVRGQCRHCRLELIRRGEQSSKLAPPLSAPGAIGVEKAEANDSDDRAQMPKRDGKDAPTVGKDGFLRWVRMVPKDASNFRVDPR